MPASLLRSRFACALLAGAIAGAPREAAAQAPAGGEPPVDPAVEAFDQAMEYKVAESDCGSAVPFFEKAWSLRKSYEIAANYGQCEQHLGRHPHAAELLRWALDHLSVAATDVDKRNVEAVFEASLRKLISLFHDFGNYGKWVHQLAEMEVLHESDDLDYIVRQVLNTPWPLPKREMIVRTALHASEEGALALTMTGIPDYARQRVFERFYSLPRPDTGKKSSGLGLCFVKEAVTLHQGTVELLDGDHGKGTKAVVVLP